MANQINQPAPGQMQVGATAETMVLQPRLNRMAPEPAAPVVRGAMMPSQPPPTPPGVSAPGPVMEPFHVVQAPVARPAGEMQPHPRSGEDPAAARESYVRMRVRVTHGKMSIVSVTSVDGPLAPWPEIVGEHAYEVMLDAKPIAVEGIPDIGIQRSYPRPGGHEHFVTERETFEFTVRIPRPAMPGDAVKRVGIALFRFPDAGPKPVRGPIAQQFGPQAKVLARLDALPETAFEPEARLQVRRLFPSSFR